MGQIGLSGRRGATGDVGASAERRNASEMPICPTEGRTPVRRGVVARLARCPTSRGGARLATTHKRAVKPIQSGKDVL